MWFCITGSDHELDFHTACSKTSTNRSFHPSHPFLAVGPGGTDGRVFLSKAPLNKTQNIYRYTLTRTVAPLQKPPSMLVWQWNINPIRRMMQSQQQHHSLLWGNITGGQPSCPFRSWGLVEESVYGCLSLDGYICTQESVLDRPHSPLPQNHLRY